MCTPDENAKGNSVIWYPKFKGVSADRRGPARPGPTQAGLGGLSREPKFGKSNINIYILF